MLRARQILGKYRIERRLAEGGFAEVYRAYDQIEGVRVALKVPHRAHVNPEMLESFRKEVRLSSTLDHPNILPIKNAQFIDRQFVVAYPLGEATLGERMQRRIGLAIRLDFARQMLQAVAHAHEHSIIHCDLKPENFILFSGNRLRLTDFGISRLAARTVLASGSGTVGYVAPEQAMGRASFQSDVFSMGLILLQLFSGKLPEWPYEWPPPGFDKLRRDLHPDLIALLQRATDVRQGRRFPDVMQMLTAFERLRARNRIVSIASRRRRRTPRRTSDWKTIRQRQFLREYRGPLEVRERCSRCAGPVSESMMACPWCGVARTTHRGETRHPARCPRCKRGRKLDWRFCPWCYGRGFRQVSSRSYSDRSYSARCANPACSRRSLMPFMRYCPWCQRKVRRPFKVGEGKHRCAKCRWGVLPEYWSFCPWCRSKLPGTP
ncbi:MAG: serine/threonine-protein kinase [Myxococcota bacterium]